MLDAINQDYIRTARAKGVKNKWIVLKHALRNSLIPVVTFLGPLIAFIITGSFVVEGFLLWRILYGRDYGRDTLQLGSLGEINEKPLHEQV